jgi:hypothetical protein
MLICALVEFEGIIWACVKMLWTAILKLRPELRADLKEFMRAESTITCEHCKCRLLIT